MAIYNGREVTAQVLPRTSYEPADNIQVTDKQGQTFMVKLSEVQFTEEEKKNLQVETGKRYDTVKIISDKDLQELKDGQDPKKTAEQMKKAEAPKDVTIHAQGATVVSQPKATQAPVVKPLQNEKK